MTFVKNFWKEEDGQDLIEYSLLLAFLALFAVGSFQIVNTQLGLIWTAAQDKTTTAATCAGGGACL